MKKLYSFLITLAICVGFGLSLFIVFTRLSDSARDMIISNIPFLGKKQQATFSTKASVLESRGMLTLKTASFDIDFLVHLEHEKGRFIALYPYQVTAGLDLKKVEIQHNKDVLHITLNAPQILSSSSSDASRVLVLTDSLPSSFSDYDTYIKPVKRAFEQKALDEAVRYGILQRCASHAEQFLSSLFAQEPIIFEYHTAFEQQSPMRINAPSMPVYFSMSKLWSSPDVEVCFIEPSYLSRDELYISLSLKEEGIQDDTKEPSYGQKLQKIRFGRISTFNDETYVSAEEKIRKSAGEHELTAVFSNPLQSSDSTTVLIADQRGYYRSITVFKDGLASYLETSDISAQLHIQDYSPLLFYTAMSINYDSSAQSIEKKEENAKRSAYSAVYDKAGTALKKKNFAAVNQYTALLRSQETRDPDVIMLMSLNDFLYKNLLNPTNLAGYEHFDDQLSAAHIIKNNAADKLTSENRQKLLGMYMHEKRLKEYFEAYFLKYKKELNLSQEEEELYIDDLIMSGAVITRELFGSLSDDKRKTYLENIMLFNDENNVVHIENDGGVTYILCGTAYEKIYTQKNRGPAYIKKQLMRTASSINPAVVLVFPEKRLFTEFSVIVFEKNSLILFNNITSALFVNEHIRLTYDSVSFYGDNFRLANFTYTDPLVRSVLYQLHQVYAREESYALDITGDLSAQLIKTVSSITARPSL